MSFRGARQREPGIAREPHLISLRSRQRTYARLAMTLIAAAVRHAITLPPKEARLLLATFKRMLRGERPAL